MGERCEVGVMALFFGSASSGHLRGFHVLLHAGIIHFTNKIEGTRVFYTDT